MSIRNAQIFLNKLREDELFREEVVIANTENDLNTILHNHGISFSSPEMEEAFNMLHVACQTEEDAEYLKQAYLYYQLLISSSTN